jgi:catechol 2,3-dioxygenase-like lactoylglutathione lyase family enzyme
MMGAFPTSDMELTRLLVVSDVDRSREWYTSVLGASIVREDEASCVLDLLGNWLLLVTGSAASDDIPALTLAPPDDRDRVSAQMIFRVPDCPDAYETLRARGAEFLTPPADKGDEVRAFFHDPDGHLFEISSVAAATSPLHVSSQPVAFFIPAPPVGQTADAAGDNENASPNAAVEPPVR